MLGTLVGAVCMVAAAVYVRFTIGEVSPRRVLVVGVVATVLTTLLVSGADSRWGERQ